MNVDVNGEKVDGWKGFLIALVTLPIVFFVAALAVLLKLLFFFVLAFIVLGIPAIVLLLIFKGFGLV